MNKSEQYDLLLMLKALADDNRLAMLSWLSQEEITAGDLAARLSLAESTVSHHISKLHSVGLLNLRMAGNQRFYRANPNKVAKLKAYMNEIDQPVQMIMEPPDDWSWLEALPWDEADKAVLKAHTAYGKLKRQPSKLKNWPIILRWLVMLFEADRYYTEREVSEMLKEKHEDYATLRRHLVDYGYLRRERGGGRYWLAPEDEAKPLESILNQG